MLQAAFSIWTTLYEPHRIFLSWNYAFQFQNGPLPIIKGGMYIACIMRTLPRCTLATAKIRCHYKLLRRVEEHTSEKSVKRWGSMHCSPKTALLEGRVVSFKNMFSWYVISVSPHIDSKPFFLKSELNWVWCDFSKGKVKSNLESHPERGHYCYSYHSRCFHCSFQLLWY